ncbi:alpha/beta fold hydrolase [Paraburkholderia sp. BL21I4N1]|uniref:alpha/beta fold hydrolase n=1 Tax=Paraburkholderia sp. BL21I4N1 TaxID=1938801 RepID=UPI000D49FAC0|nr:alpha/beta hydrolase [Paraburkholderia sp. BL21I4N1]PQV54710.1 pimeloyl-ACP methyl ester carboxylesterase [Paraburkholderia sp. BL21I4N1]
MHELQIETLQVGALRMRVASQGSGPLVLLCHGFPESWSAWRHQLAALAAAGFRAVAPDMRGYGGTDAPPDADAYTMLHLVGDMVELVNVLGEREAVIVGHDWGAPVAWHAAMLRPDLFRAVAGMSVPFYPPARDDLLTALERQGVHTFYMQYFQTPGVAEAEFEADPEAALRRVTFSMSGDGPDRIVAGILNPGAGFLDNTVDPETLPSWLDREEIAYVAGEFARTGFRGGLNWYRAIRRTSELMAAWRGCVIRQPSLFVAGAKDDVLKFPGAQARIEHLASVLPGLRGCHILEGAGHWIQRERAVEVSNLLVAFLKGL